MGEAFHAFSGGKEDMDGRTFVKLCKDCGLFDKKFVSTDADIVFSKAVPKGQRRLGLADFQRALDFVAQKKNVSVETLRGTVAGSRGPVLHATAPEAVRFHDDKSTYTGVHAAGGPESVAKGLGTSKQLASECMKRAA